MYRPTQMIEFIHSIDVDVDHTFYEIYMGISSFDTYWWMSLVAILIIIPFSISVMVTVDRHLKIGHFDMTGPFRKINENLISNIPVYIVVVLAVEICHLLISMFISLWLVICTTDAMLYLANMLSALFVILLALSVVAKAMFWIPHMLQTGYRGGRAFADAIRAVKGNFWRMYLHTLVITMPIVALLVVDNVLSLGLGWLVSIIGCLVVFPFFSVYPFIAYYDAEGIDREDLKNQSIWKINK